MSGSAEGTTTALPTTTKDAIEQLRETVLTLSLAELNEGVARCDRLLANPMVLKRIPGRTDEVRSRKLIYQQRLDQLQQQPQSQQASSSSSSSSRKPSGTTQEQQHVPQEEQEKFLQQVADKYRHHRVNLEEEFRKSFGSMLSETEIQKRLSEMPKGYFLTFQETLEMQRESMKRQRAREMARLQKLREQQQLQQQQLQQQQGTRLNRETQQAQTKRVEDDEKRTADGNAAVSED